VNTLLRKLLQLPKCRDQELTFVHTAEIQKQGAHEEANETESEEKTLMVLNLTDGLGLNEGGIKVVEENDWTEQQAAALRQTIIRMLPLYDEILEEKKSTSFLIISSHFQRLV
jgi:hypothetical protein